MFMNLFNFSTVLLFIIEIPSFFIIHVVVFIFFYVIYLFLAHSVIFYQSFTLQTQTKLACKQSASILSYYKFSAASSAQHFSLLHKTMNFLNLNKRFVLRFRIEFFGSLEESSHLLFLFQTQILRSLTNND